MVIERVTSSLRITSFLVFLALVPHELLAAPAQVSLPSQTAAPGSSVILPLTLATNGSAISGIQFDVQFDNSAMSLVAILGDASKNAGKVLYQGNLAPNAARFLIVGLNTNLMDSGILINLFINLNPNGANGASPLAVSNVVATDPFGATVSVAGSGGAVTVAGTINQSVPLQTAGVLNAASLVSGPLTPGEIFTLIGSSIGSVTGTQVTFDGIAASLLYVSANQINGVTPYEVAGQAATTMGIINQGQLTSSLMLPVVPASPAIFTLDGSGVGQGAILNQDSSINSWSNPAGRGTIVAFYATGAGQTNPPGVDGQIVGTLLSIPVLPVSVQIDGLDAPVFYAGAAPGLITGILQVNCRIPANVTPGATVSIVLTVGSASSPQSVTIAVN